MNGNSSKIILDLCGGTGAWSRPYKEAGYDVRLVTLPDCDVRTYQPPENVHGILAAPPCTMFSNARNAERKPSREEFDGALEIVNRCIQIIKECKPIWWALENPPGKLAGFLGRPRLIFQPWEYGDPWTKKTFIWGKFNRPMKFFPMKSKGSLVQSGKSKGHISLRDIPLPPGTAKKMGQRIDSIKYAITPPGFAKVFMEANP